jgi:phosphatidylserine synthase
MKSSKKNLLAELSLADYITVLSNFLILNGFWLLWNGHMLLAIAVVFVSMYLDYLDGWTARKYGGSPYGKVLDSLYDILGWVLFPALVVNIQTHWAWWSVVITTLYCMAAAIRLSRFTVAGYVETDKRYYTGMPVSYSRYALLVVLLAGGVLSAVMLAIMIPLMVSSRLFRKSPPILMQINLVYAAIFLTLYLRNGSH